jgi:hypothetical protein
MTLQYHVLPRTAMPSAAWSLSESDYPPHSNVRGRSSPRRDPGWDPVPDASVGQKGTQAYVCAPVGSRPAIVRDNRHDTACTRQLFMMT